MPTAYDFVQVDVFSPEPYRGNPVAVIHGADALDAATMQRVARWTNLSETTFLLQPTSPEADYRVRIFTPGGELPFAGHPTLGSAHAWLEAGGQPKSSDRVIQQSEAGLVPVRRGELLSFAAPPMRRTGAMIEAELAPLLAALGVAPERVLDHQWVDNGPGWCVVRLRTAQEVLDLDPDLSGIPEAMVGVIGAYPAGSPHAFEMRTFAPGVGVPEDPVCGSMNASVGQWLTSTGVVDGDYAVSQGQRLGRAGSIAISLDDDGQVWVGGATTTRFRGSALI
ncbi:PhzF family phenazine biosynthesis protein [Agrococcus sp. Marseille-P2731]|uniref:PhzF family phenazine biosynthesis protein n=1 Tax=Agrococcus sp. Marseille-P2731 TaxID=1841862 RepID=UPI00093051CA|nr:PhzF family phenazine biosynthesis protein [Agrococcus sp. Marseille-P2731]